MKKFLALLLALVMVLGLATTAFAAENEGTIVNETDRVYEAYQIFAGTQADGGAVLGDVVWGNGIDVTTFLDELQDLKVGNATPFASCTNAADVAAVLAGNSNDAEIAKAFANLAAQNLDEVAAEVGAQETVTLDSGYYLLIDVTSEDDLGEDETYNPALLQVTNGNTLNITLKSAGAPEFDKDLEDGTDATTANIGEKVTYVLTATMPAKLDGYDSYTLIFHDELSKGLDYNRDAVVSAKGFTVNFVKNANGTTTITVSNTNVLDDGIKAGDTITVTYSATVNSEAVIGAAGNPNKAYLDYSHNPNNETETKQTPEDEVKVFTFQLDVTKVDGQEGFELADAQFVLLNSDKTKVATVVDGKLTGWVNVPAAVNGQITWPANTVMTSDENGLFGVQGLKDGTYFLREIKAPAGYNLLKSDVEFVITATITDTEDEQTLTGLTINIGGETSNGVISSGLVEASVENNAGSVLPETGGMGTTMFYIFGFTMMMAAVVLLVTKKRMADAV